jgi:3-oxoacyl-[acyl-carrier-protein] synthase-3
LLTPGVRTRIVATGSYLPARCVGNAEVCAALRLDAEAVYRRTGIRTRHWAAESEASSQLGEQAARAALAAAGLEAGAVDALLVSTTSPDMAFPSTACHLQRLLGASRSAAFDLAASCSGFLYGLSMADQLIRSGQFRRCLVVAAEVKSRFLNRRDEQTAILFGDGAGAAVLEATEQAGPDTGHILGIRLHADGSRQTLIEIPAGGSRRPTSAESVGAGLHAIRMKGNSLYRIAIRRLAEAATDLLKEFGVGLSDVGRVIFHQANGRLLRAVCDRLGIPPEKFFTSVEDFGNTSSASLPIALDCAVRGGYIHRGDLVLLGAFGGGLTWATGLVRW